MTYRIRFRPEEGDQEAEAVVEANSPTEAMVKFHHAQDRSSRKQTAMEERITSVRPELFGDACSC